MLGAGSRSRCAELSPKAHHKVQRMIFAPPRLPNPKPILISWHQIILTGWYTPKEIPSPCMLGAGSRSRCAELSPKAHHKVQRMIFAPPRLPNTKPLFLSLHQIILTGWCTPKEMPSPYMLVAGSPSMCDELSPKAHHKVQRMIVAPPRLPNPKPLLLVLHQIILTGWCTPKETSSPYMLGAGSPSRCDELPPKAHHKVQRMIVAPLRLPNTKPLLLVLHQNIVTGWCTPEEIILNRIAKQIR